MARPKEFDRADVLDLAMQVFWEKGFEATSINDLVRRMGIGRASLYDTFGSKRDLMFAAMDCYIDRMRTQVLEALHRPGSPREIILGLFMSMIEKQQQGHSKSCLVAKSAMMTGRDNAELMDRVCRFMDLIETEFHGLLVRARKNGDIDSSKDPLALARFFRQRDAGHQCDGQLPGDTFDPRGRRAHDSVGVGLNHL